MIRIQFRQDPLCAKHGKRYSRGSTCVECREARVPTERRKKAATARTVKTPARAVPYKCGCGRTVTNSAGICPGENC